MIVELRDYITMDLETLKVFGKVAGLAGLSLGIVLLLFRDIIRKRIFPKLDPDHGYRLLRLIVILVWSLAIVGIAAWAYTSLERPAANSKAVWITRGAMPCRWAWLYLGDYSNQSGTHFLNGFTFGTSGNHPLFPKEGDEIVLTSVHKWIITNYADAEVGHKCDSILEPPWGYNPTTAYKFEAGAVSPDTRVLVKKIQLMPDPDEFPNEDPRFVWALAGPQSN